MCKCLILMLTVETFLLKLSGRLRQGLNTTTNIINTKIDRLITIREASKPNEPFEMIFRLRHRTLKLSNSAPFSMNSQSPFICNE